MIKTLSYLLSRLFKLDSFVMIFLIQLLEFSIG